MKKFNLPFFDPNDMGAKVSVLIDPTTSTIEARVNSILIEAIETREGKVVNGEAVEKWGRREPQINGEQFIYWKGKPLLWLSKPEIDEVGRVTFKYKIMKG